MAFSLLRVTVNRQRHKAQSDDESCVCARWVATTCLFILFIHFYVLRNVLEHAYQIPKVSWCIVRDSYDEYNGRYIFYLLYIF